MEIVLCKMLFIASVSALKFGKHVYVHHKHPWHEARTHCKDHYIDLSPITTPWVEEKLKTATLGKVGGEFWIGLHIVETQWSWAGGGDATNISWAESQPDDIANQKVCCVCWHNCDWNGWHNSRSSHDLPFFCFNLIVIKIRETWENAVRYCRNKHTTLTSLPSETEVLLALSKIKDDPEITDRVWIGLRYLGDIWLWVDGHPLEYQAWLQGGDQDHLCPIRKRCGALTKDGVWENLDCQEQLNFICY